MRSLLVIGAWCALAPSGPARAGVTPAQLLGRLDSIGLSADEAEQVRLRLGDDALPGQTPARRNAASELRVLADSFGGKTNVPTVTGVCVDKNGRQVPCGLPGAGDRLYTAPISGDCGCHDVVVQSVQDLRTVVLERGQGSGRTGSEYFDRFFLYLIEQFTDAGRGLQLPRVVEGSPSTGDIGTYDGGVITIGPDFCLLPRTMRRKLMGHGFFHRWDDGLDGDPLPSKDQAEIPAFAVMEFL